MGIKSQLVPDLSKLAKLQTVSESLNSYSARFGMVALLGTFLFYSLVAKGSLTTFCSARVDFGDALLEYFYSRS